VRSKSVLGLGAAHYMCCSLLSAASAIPGSADHTHLDWGDDAAVAPEVMLKFRYCWRSGSVRIEVEEAMREWSSTVDLHWTTPMVM
jgi:hypothetical protein